MNALGMAAIPTATTTTCLVVSLPASTLQLTFSSGDSRIFPDTTYTSPTTVTEVEQGTIVARCFTLTPGQTSFASIPDVGVTCSTDFLSLTTDFITRTSGYVDPFVGTTYTAATTRTIVLEPTSLVDCSVLPDYKNAATCNSVSSLTWASLVLTFVTVQLTWWIFDIPLLWTSKNKGGGIKPFLKSVSWTCVRSHVPGTAGTIAAMRGKDTSDFARIYYLGFTEERLPPPWTRWKLFKNVAADLLTVVTTCVTVYEACTLSQFDSRQAFGLGLWTYPTLPVALVGLCLLGGEFILPRTARAGTILFLVTLFVLVSVGAAIGLVLWRFDTTSSGRWYFAVFCYTFMLLPAHCIPRLVILFCALAWMVRVGGVSFAALGHYAGGQPYCYIQGVGFAAVYMTLGAIAAVFALVGSFYHSGTARLRRWGRKSKPQDQPAPRGTNIQPMAQYM